MPQMSPINWLLLFFVFSLTFILFNMMNFYLYTPSLPKSISIHKNIEKSLNWKW